MEKPKRGRKAPKRQRTSPFLDLVRMVAPFDSIDFLSTVAALQLLPENADRLLRLEMMAHAIATSKPRKGRPRITRHRVKTICNSAPWAASIAHQEDPFDNPFCEDFTFLGGSYTVFPSVFEDSTYILRHLCKSIILIQEPFPNKRFFSASKDFILAMLTLSQEVARRSGLSRGTEPISAPGGEVVIPPSAKLSDLKTAVKLSKEEIEEILGEASLPISVLDTVTVGLGHKAIGHYNADNPPLAVTPFVDVGDSIIVAIPSFLLIATRNDIVRKAQQHDVVEELAKRYSASVWDTTKRMITVTGHKKLVSSFVAPDVPCVRDGLFHLDADKAMYIILASDTFADYHYQFPFGRSDNSIELKHVVQGLHDAEESVLSGHPSPNELLVVVLFQGIGRVGFLGFTREEMSKTSLMLAMTASDLETILFLDGGDPLALWKFARAARRVRERTTVLSIGKLNEYCYYQEHDYSYYFSDDHAPIVINLTPGGTGSLRRKVQKERDWHAAPSVDVGYIVEVTSLHGTASIPIYVPFHKLGKEPLLLVEGLPVPIWVQGRPYTDNPAARAANSYTAEFVEAISYWMWQLTPSLKTILKSLEDTYERVLVKVNVTEPDSWDPEHASMRADGGRPVSVTTDQIKGIVKLSIHPAIIRLCMGPRNDGERALIEELLGGIKELVPAKQKALLSGEAVRRMLDRHAPLGPKKKFLILESDTASLADSRELPSFRKVQNVDVNQLLDEFAEMNKSGNGHAADDIPNGKRNEVLNELVVPFYVSQLDKLVSTLSQEGYWETVIGLNESIVRETVIRDLTVPTRMACYFEQEEMVAQVNKETQEVAVAALASRFLIEYSIANPPQGIRPISLDVYDRLMALANLIVQTGMLSDLIYYGLADIHLSILPSGRLGFDRATFEEAQSAYMTSYTTQHVESLRRDFEKHWQRTKGSKVPPKRVEDLDHATMCEFGYTITEILELTSSVLLIGDNFHRGHPSLPLSDLIKRLASRLAWTEEKAIGAIELLKLGARSDYWIPPDGFASFEVYPWRFNRTLSYIRRPFLQVNVKGDPVIYWGPRHLRQSQKYLVGLCAAGRLRAQSDEMKRLMGTINHEQGEFFNDTVADIIEQLPGRIVRRRVRTLKVGTQILEVPGDIDVLSVQPSRRLVEVIECKDFSLARTPAELANELSNLFQGRAGERSALSKTQDRANWVTQHLKQVLQWVGTDPKGRWTVEPLIVTSRELFTPHLQTHGANISSIREFEIKRSGR